MNTYGKYNQIKGTSLELIERLHNDSKGPSARLIAFKEGLRAALEAFDVKFTLYMTGHLEIVDGDMDNMI